MKTSPQPSPVGGEGVNIQQKVTQPVPGDTWNVEDWKNA
jgi:hypothetical protein